jgi:hypothetical protein
MIDSPARQLLGRAAIFQVLGRRAKQMRAAMSSFATYTADNPPEAARASLKGAKASFGFIPNLQATIGRDVAVVAWARSHFGVVASFRP